MIIILPHFQINQSQLVNQDCILNASCNEQTQITSNQQGQKTYHKDHQQREYNLSFISFINIMIHVSKCYLEVAQQQMNLKDQISKFRGQILIGNYTPSITLGKAILAKLQLLVQLGIIKDDKLHNSIQQQYQKCLTISSIIRGKTICSEDQSVKKWENKQKGSKWVKPQRTMDDLHKIKAPKNPSLLAQSQYSPIKMIDEESLANFMDKIQKQIIMPIKMPVFFKEKGTQYKIVSIPEERYQNCLDYFIENGFFHTIYEIFSSQFSRKYEQNYFNLNNISEIVIDSKYIDASMLLNQRSNKYDQFHCIFLIHSNKQFSIL